MLRVAVPTGPHEALSNVTVPDTCWADAATVTPVKTYSPAIAHDVKAGKFATAPPPAGAGGP
jgi:hypothetical protein